MKKILSLIFLCCFSFSAFGASDFKLQDLNGKSFSLSQFKGKSKVLVVFWTTWCPPCRKEVPELIKLQNEAASKNVKILAINVEGKEKVKEVKQFVKDNKINYTVLIDADGSVANEYKVLAIPTNILVNEKGEIVYRGYRLPEKELDI